MYFATSLNSVAFGTSTPRWGSLLYSVNQWSTYFRHDGPNRLFNRN